MKKNKTTIVLGSVVTILIILISVSTYALWQLTRKQTNKNVLGSACLSISLENETNDINLSSTIPLTDEDGKETTPYEFVIKNNCDTPVNYTIAIENIKDDEVSNDSDYLNPKYIKVMLNNSEPASFSSFEDLTNDANADYEIISTKGIVNRQLAGNEFRKYFLRLWVDENTPIQEEDGSLNGSKYFFSRIKVIAGADITDSCYAINSAGLITDYDYECGNDIVVPNSINGTYVTTIGSNTFYHSDFAPYSDFYQDGLTIDDADFSLAISLNMGLMITENGDPNNEYLTPEDKAALSPDDIWFVNHIGTEGDGVIDNICKVPTADTNLFPMMSAAFNSYILDEQGNPYDISIIFPYCNDSEVGKDVIIEDAKSVTNYGILVHYKIIGEGENAYPVPIGTTVSDEYNYKIGFRPTSVSVVDSLDLSQAYALTEIKKNAFRDYNANTLSLPSGLSIIGDYAFNQYSGNSITFGPNITKIGAFAFRSYAGDELSLPSTVISIGESAFVFYNGAQLSLPNSLKSLGASCFYNYEGINQNLTIPNGVKILEDSVFYEFNGQSLVLPSSLMVIGNSAFVFYNGENLTLPSSLTSIGNYAFNNYHGTENDFVIPNNVLTIGNSAFATFNGKSLTLGTSVKEIGSYAFTQYEGRDTENQTHEDLELPSSLEKIGEAAFLYFKGNLIINYGVKEIGNRAFANYTGSYNHSDLKLPNSIKKIGDNAFRNLRLDSSDKLVLPNKIEEIGASAFYSYSGGNNELIIPKTLKEIKNDTFYLFDGILSFEADSSITKIGNNAFYSYDGDIGPGFGDNFPKNIESIGDNAFHSYNGYINFASLSKLKTIGAGAFSSYTSHDVEIPYSVTSIGENAFENFGTDSYHTITVHSQELYNTRSSWAPNATVNYVP